MTKWTLVQVFAVLLAFAAAVISFNLLAKHLGGSSGPAWFAAGCSEDDQGRGADCAAVLASRYASLPFRKETDPPGAIYTPVAFLGLIYYSTLIIWLIAIGRPSYTRRSIHLLPLGLVAVGLMSSAFFTYVMFTELDEWCPWCLVTHILNLLTAILLILMWPWSQVDVEITAPVDSAPSPAPGGDVAAASLAVHPSNRLVLVVLAAMAFLAFGQWEMLGKAQVIIKGAKAQRGFNACMAAVKRIQGNAGGLLVNWQNEQRQDITIRPDDPRRAPDNSDRPALELVLFSDFECNSCRELAEFLHHKARPLFDGSLQLTYKHYPLNPDCNPRTITRVHGHACEAARLAEAARIVGGNDAFWKAHDFVFKNQDLLKKGKLTPEKVAQRLGVDLERFLDAAKSAKINERIAEDADLARRCGATSTPALFINGKRVETLATNAIGFWDLLADLYWKNVKIPRPAAARLPAQEPTRDTPDPSAAP
ncbi:MAG: vitamin K epoxide reductase family protein [Planctomycetota bacterium]|jgi:protein-disulfide isomerase/uncharacterized membrane protein